MCGDVKTFLEYLLFISSWAAVAALAFWVFSKLRTLHVLHDRVYDLEAAVFGFEEDETAPDAAADSGPETGAAYSGEVVETQVDAPAEINVENVEVVQTDVQVEAPAEPEAAKPQD